MGGWLFMNKMNDTVIDGEISQELEDDYIIEDVGDVQFNGTKSKSRVKENGEVFTPNKTVCDMMDLLKEEGYRVESKVLEPSCGNGNFLVEILKRKTQEVYQRYLNSNNDIDVYNLNLAIAVSNIYGVDIMPDNISEAQSRLRNGTATDNEHIGYVEQYKIHTGEDIPDWLDKTLMFIIKTNIQLGNMLTGEKLYARGKVAYSDPDDNHLLVSEWNFNGSRVKRVDYYMNNIDMVAQDGYREVDYARLSKQKYLGVKELDC